MSGRYEDIIDLPRHVSKTRPRMPLADRAAQFSPFAALKGYDEEIEEAARITEGKIELDESRMSAINELLISLKGIENESPVVEITYFKTDERKDGGAYLTACGPLKRIDEAGRKIILSDGTAIPMQDLLEINKK